MNRAILIVLALSSILVGGNAAGKRAPLLEASICVKYGRCPLEISSFTCTDYAKEQLCTPRLLRRAKVLHGH